MSITMQDIAQKAGVSRSAVSFVLNNKPISSQITEETREKILKAANELNYRPNNIALSLKIKKTKTIGVVFASALGAGTFMNEIIDGINTGIHQHGYNLFLCISDNDWRKEARHVRMLREKRVDGMIVFFVSCQKEEKANHDHLLEVKKDGIPLVFIDKYLPDTDIDYVITDDFGGAYEAVTHLIKLGHRKIAHITAPIDCTSVSNRLEGYKKALIDAGLEVKEKYIRPVDYYKKDNNWKYDGYQITKDFLKMGEDRPTAIFTVNDGIAIDSFRVIKESGLSVPEDIALVGFGNSIESALVEVPITVVDQPKSEMGDKAVEVILRKIELSEPTKTEQITIRPKLIIRQSCGASKMMTTAGAIS